MGIFGSFSRFFQERYIAESRGLLRCIQCIRTLYTIHYTLYTVQCTLYTVHCTLYTVHCTLYSVHCTLYTVHCTLYTIHYTGPGQSWLFPADFWPILGYCGLFKTKSWLIPVDILSYRHSLSVSAAWCLEVRQGSARPALLEGRYFLLPLMIFFLWVKLSMIFCIPVHCCSLLLSPSKH